MIKTHRVLKRLSQVFSTVLLASLLWFSSASLASVQALPLVGDSGSSQILSDINRRGPYTEGRKADPREATEAQLDRYQRAAERIPKNLGNAEKNTQRRVDRAVNELGNDQLERAFGGLGNAAKRSDAEQKLERNATGTRRQAERAVDKVERSAERASDKAERQLNKASRGAERTGEDLGNSIQRTGEDLGETVKRTVEGIGDTLQGK